VTLGLNSQRRRHAVGLRLDGGVETQLGKGGEVLDDGRPRPPSVPRAVSEEILSPVTCCLLCCVVDLQKRPPWSSPSIAPMDEPKMGGCTHQRQARADVLGSRRPHEPGGCG
jgi:hypothetical protein